MKACLSLVLAASLLSLLGGDICFSQESQSTEKLAEQARQEYSAGKFAYAERDFRELAKRDPSNVEDEVYLGQALFRQEKYAESVVPYEKARELERNGSKLTSDQHRITAARRMNALYVHFEAGRVRSPKELIAEGDARAIIHTLRVAIDRIMEMTEYWGHQIGKKGFMK